MRAAVTPSLPLCFKLRTPSVGASNGPPLAHLSGWVLLAVCFNTSSLLRRPTRNLSAAPAETLAELEGPGTLEDPVACAARIVAAPGWP